MRVIGLRAPDGKLDGLVIRGDATELEKAFERLLSATEKADGTAAMHSGVELAVRCLAVLTGSHEWMRKLLGRVLESGGDDVS